jgi:tetratricopeptide (TPR) repeat protein
MTPDEAFAAALGQHRAGALDTAEQLYRALLAGAPDDARCLHFLGVIAHQRGAHRDAAALIARALAQRPDYAEAHANLGLVLETLGESAAALPHLERALALKPDYAEAHNNLGRTLDALGRRAEAVRQFERALALDPNFAEARNNLANLLKDAGRLDEAVAHYEAALAVRPGLAELHRNLGLALQAQRRSAAAVARFAAAAALAPQNPASHFDLGNGLRDALRLDEAVAAYERALALDPGHADAQCNLGIALHAQGKLDAASACFGRALALDPDHANAHVNLGMTRLLQGDFAGFRDYEWRWRAADAPRARNFAAPQWQGEALAGASILLHAEQGFGDTIQFVRYARLVAARGGRIVLEAPAPLERLFAPLPEIDSVVRAGASLPPVEFHCPLLSLPLACGTTLATVPAETPYLAANPAQAARWRERFAARPGLRVGLVWAGRPSHPRDRERSLAPEQLEPLGGVPGVAFVSLQLRAEGMLLPARLEIDDVAAELGDFADTAAAIAALDLVITVDTAVAHLAGALGARVWVLLPHLPDWRWLMARADTPWYPTARLFRQGRAGEWAPVIAAVKAALESRAAAPRGRLPERPGAAMF